MPRGIPVTQEIKNEVINKIRNEGMSVKDACVKYGVQSKSVYTWLRGEIVDGNRNLILENNRLKKQLEIAERIIGRMTVEIKRGKQ